MIEECNFKFKLEPSYIECELGLKKECSGEDACILYQIYLTNHLEEIKIVFDDKSLGGPND